jgi:hypothetical protein
MSVAEEERHTHHYRGVWHGFGPVQDAELVLFAVFQTTKIDGQSLSENSFRNDSLARKSESVARQLYVTRRSFDFGIVAAAELTKGNLVGVTSANVARLRNLRADFDINNVMTKLPAICVLDRVDFGDINGHAVLGYRDAPAGISPQQLGKKRKLIRIDLANEFSEIRSADRLQWPSPLNVLFGRVASIFRIIRRLVSING